MSVKDRLPVAYQWVTVVTPHFRCMGYLDKEGKWRDANRREEILDVEAWTPLAGDETSPGRRRTE